MTHDVLVKRCELSVRGRGGWGWGADPRRYVDAALPEIGRAIQQVISEADLPTGVEVLLTAPVQLAWRPDHTLDDSSRQAFVAALRDAVPTTPPAGPGGPVTPRVARPDHAVPSEEGRVPPPEPASAIRLAALLGAWSRTGRLAHVVAGWPEAVVLRWIAAVTVAAPGSTAAVELDDDVVDGVAATVLVQARVARPLLRAAHRELVVLGALVGAVGGRPVGPGAARRAARAAGSPDVDVGRPASSDSVPLEVSTGAAPGIDHRARRSRTPTPSGGLTVPQVVPGLPFLVLIQLARLGYLEAVWALAATTDDEASTSAGLVGGLAGKVLPPPGRGWRRTASESAAVQIASGRDGRAWDRAVEHVRRAAGLLDAPLGATLVGLYADPGPPSVELTETGHGLVVGEHTSALPIAWLADGADPAPVLRQLGEPSATRTELFAPFAASLHERRAFPVIDLPSLERHLGAAVGTALGSLAIELWGATSDAPQLTLDRLADLEVRVTRGRGGRAPEVTVAVPRGQRWLDLGRAGLLDRWPVPWAATGWELVSW